RLSAAPLRAAAHACPPRRSSALGRPAVSTGELDSGSCAFRYPVCSAGVSGGGCATGAADISGPARARGNSVLFARVIVRRIVFGSVFRSPHVLLVRGST